MPAHASASSAMRALTDSAVQCWWERGDLRYRDGVLHLGGERTDSLAEGLGTPLYAYSAARACANLERLHSALRARGLNYRVLYAMKSNRYPPLLTVLRNTGLCGIDACSPAEVALARQIGFPESQISFTGTSVSDTDLDTLCRFPALWINCDSLSILRRLAERAPGRTIGLRVNPAVGLGYRANRLLRYAGTRPTKFGIHATEFDQALRLVESLGLELGGLHMHAGCGYLTPELEAWERALDACARFLDRCPPLKHVNVGGGLGVPRIAEDRPLDLERWSEILARKLGDRDVEIWMEPGDYLVRDAGILLLQVNTVEVKAGVRFVGVNGGFNLHMEPAFYDLPLEIVPVRPPSLAATPDTTLPTTVAGNINEALDVWAEDLALPAVQEGDYLALLNAGGYGAALSSNHCMRGHYLECLLG